MSAQEAAALVHRGFEEGMNQKNLEVFDELLAPTYVNHNMPAAAPSPKGFKQVMAMFVQGFPDFHCQQPTDNTRHL